MTKICIRQPGYLPSLGFFKKIESADYFVFLDDVNYSRGDWDNRNRIKTMEGSLWLTVPILNKSEKLLNQVKINYSEDWIYKHESAIRYNYKKSPFFDLYWHEIKKRLNKKYEKLIELNMSLINYFISILQISTKTIFSSDLSINSTGSERLLDICKSLNADTYISGELGCNYLDMNIFKNENIDVVFEKFESLEYSQRHIGFRPGMSIIDLLFNEGAKSIEILHNSKNLL